MEFKINKSSEIPIYQQLKEQIKFYLLSGALQPGVKVPTPKDLGLYLQINRNTVIAAYKELEQEGLLMTKQGQGTYVTDNITSAPHNEIKLLDLAQETIDRAKELGFTPEDLYTVIFNKTILGLDAPVNNRKEHQLRALMVECNLPDLQYYQNSLGNELGLQVGGCLLDELPDKISEDYIKNADFIVTNFTHLEDVKAIFEPLQKVVFGVMAVPQFHTFIEISKLPAGTRVGCVCIKDQYGARIQKAFENAGINHLTYEHCGIENLELFNQMTDRVDYIVSSRAVIDIIRNIVPANVMILEYVNDLDQAGIDMIKQYLAKLTINEP